MNDIPAVVPRLHAQMPFGALGMGAFVEAPRNVADVRQSTSGGIGQRHDHRCRGQGKLWFLW